MSTLLEVRDLDIFYGAVRANQSADRMQFDGQRNIGHRAQAAKRFADLLYFQQRCHCATFSLLARAGRMPCGKIVTTTKSATP